MSEDIQKNAKLLVKLMGLFFIMLGLWQGLCNILETYSEFNPTYFSFYFTSQLLRPFLALALGCILIFASRFLARLLSKE
tara:strand:- start:270 stop:509 length:240 start_codon:yes stop_codon:yes gene_type:complete